MTFPALGSSSAEATLPQGANGPLLTAADLEKLERDGFVVPRFRFSEAETGRLRALLYRLFELNPHNMSHTNSPHVPGSGTMGVKSFPGWMEFCEHPAVLDMIEQVIGPDIILYGTSTFYKKAEKGRATPWHRDSATQIKPPVSPLVWIAATDAVVENGCLRFIPGTHRDAVLGEHKEWKYEDATIGYETGIQLDPKIYEDRVGSAVDVELEAGQMIIFHSRTIHSSHPNQGTRGDRASFTLRYMPGTSRYGHDDVPERSRGHHGFHTRPLILVRGVDRAGNDFRRGHPGIDPTVPAVQN